MNKKLSFILATAFAIIVSLTIVILHRERSQRNAARAQARTPTQQTNGTLKLDTSTPHFPQ